MMPFKTLWRSLRVLEHLLTGATLAVYVRLRTRGGHCPPWLPRLVSWWHGRLCRALGIRLRIEGQPQPGCLLVGNHVSWLDIPVIGAQCELGFLSKAEVRDWPLIGWMAEVAGTLFIERGAHQADRISARLAADIASGRALMIFPEGTTTNGTCVRRFHPRLFGVAQAPGIRVQAVAIGYRGSQSADPDTRVAYIGDDTLIGNLWVLLRHPGLIVSVTFLPPLSARPEDRRRDLAERARAAVAESLGLDPLAETQRPAQGWVPDTLGDLPATELGHCPT